MQFLRRIKILGICVFLFSLSVGFTTIKAAENESTELLSPISFKSVTGPQLMKNAVLIDTVYFELSGSDATMTFPIFNTDSDLIFVFHDVSTAINMSLIIGNDSKYCVGVHGKSNTIYVQISPDLEYEFELSPGVQTEFFDCCSGLLEIYQVAN